MSYKKNKTYADLKLTEEQTEMLINLYYDETNLWNTGSETYLNKDARKMSFTRILEAMEDGSPGLEATTEQIKDRLVYLRGYYSKELGKHTKSKKNSSGSDDVYNSGWKYYKKFDSFLKSQIIPRASKTNMDSTSQHTQCEETDDQFDSYCRLSDESWETRSTVASSSSSPSVPSKKRKQKDGTESMASEPDSYTSDTRARFKEFSNEKDVPAQKSDSELFGEYVTRELNNIADERSRITLKYKIQTLFYEMQLGLHSQTEQNRTTSTEPSLGASLLISNLSTPLGFGHIMQSVAPQINNVTSNFRENNRPAELYQTPQINTVTSNFRENNGQSGQYQTSNQSEETQNAEVKTESYLTLI